MQKALCDNKPELTLIKILETIPNFHKTFRVTSGIITIDDHAYQIDRIISWTKKTGKHPGQWYDLELLCEVHADHSAPWFTDGRADKDFEKAETLVEAGNNLWCIHVKGAEQLSRHAEEIRGDFWKVMLKVTEKERGVYFGSFFTFDKEHHVVSWTLGKV